VRWYGRSFLDQWLEGFIDSIGLEDAFKVNDWRPLLGINMIDIDRESQKGPKTG
jgi:hypothetical protein